QMIMQAKDWLRRKEEGQGLVEYALIILLVSIVVIIVLIALGDQINIVFNNIIDVFKAYPAP
ncbi:MAG: hypothetical protein U9R53_01035, partial [Chloroflexota bacterium]|nr:hypothetical protein [Chloroflexota bacterium]